MALSRGSHKRQQSSGSHGAGQTNVIAAKVLPPVTAMWVRFHGASRRRRNENTPFILQQQTGNARFPRVVATQFLHRVAPGPNSRLLKP